MSRWGVIGVACLILLSCKPHPPTVQPTQALDLLRTGRPVLSCRQACLDAWRHAEPKAERLAADANWNDLAVLVIETRYQDDLTLYYLGRAAQGMGYYAAAGSYYRQSLQLSGTSISCADLSRLCGGVSLPQATLRHLAEIDRALNPPKPRPARVRPPAAPAPTPAPGTEEGSGATGGYIEPPPAGR